MPEKFTFRLETLLKIRLATRDQRRAQLARVLDAERVLKQQESEVEQQLASLKHVVRKASGPGEIDVDRLLGHYRFEIVLQAQLQTVRAKSQQLQTEIERRREALVAADREVRVLEKIHERQLVAYQREAVLTETKELDEIGQRRNAE